MGADEPDLLIDESIEVKVGDVWECEGVDGALYLILEVLSAFDSGHDRFRYVNLMNMHQETGHLTIRRWEWSGVCGKRFSALWRKF